LQKPQNLVKSTILDEKHFLPNNQNMELKIHDFQASILRTLLFNPGSRFRDLNKVGVTNDHFTFHLNHLVTEGLISKENGKYSLTVEGKEFANRMDTDSLKLEKQAKLGVAIHAIRQNKGKTEYLVHHRLKEPFFGWYGSHSGKIRWGESPMETAKREFMEETGMTGDFTLKGIIHYNHFFKDGKLLEDKFFWVFRVYNVKGELKEKVEEGENIWMTKKEYKKLKNVFGTYEEMIQFTNSKCFLYVERQRFVDSY
jgi:8-oxo-dGTP pyrophosphatase MutT (NUDIX family)